MRFSDYALAGEKVDLSLYVLPLFFSRDIYYSMQERSKGICEDVHRAGARGWARQFRREEA